MLEIILIRHGETDNNKNSRFSGSTADVNINEKGREQAKKLAAILKEDVIAALYSSDMKRCVETGKHISCDRIHYTDNLREMDFGHWEGLNYNEIKNKYPAESEQWEKDWSCFAIPEGESFLDMGNRVLKEFREIIAKHKGNDEKIAIITHGGCIRTILGQHIIGSIKDCWRFQVENAAVSRLCLDKNFFYLKSLNEKN